MGSKYEVLARYDWTASRMMAVLASTQLIPGGSNGLEPPERAQCQPDVGCVAHEPSGTGTLDPGALLDPPVVVLNGPTELGETATGSGPSSPSRWWPQYAVPPFGVAIPKHLDQPVPGQPTSVPVPQWPCPSAPACLGAPCSPTGSIQSGQPRPPRGRINLRLSKSCCTSCRTHAPGRKPAPVGGAHHVARSDRSWWRPSALSYTR